MYPFSAKHDIYTDAAIQVAVVVGKAKMAIIAVDSGIDMEIMYK